MENKGIYNAMNALRNRVDKANLSDNEKNALYTLIDKLTIYGENRYNYIINHGRVKNRNNRITELNVEMTDYFVDINDAINGHKDVFYVVSTIYSAIKYDEKKDTFKRKILNFFK